MTTNEYRLMAIACVKETALPLLKKRFDECHGDLDLFFSDSHDSIYSFSKVIEPGKCYEQGYPQCFCPLYETQRSTITVAQCECSRQSILYILGELCPEKHFEVETIETIIGGAERCLFHITVIQ